MNRNINFLILYLSIFITEIANCFLMVYFQSTSDTPFRGGFDVATLWSIWKLIFYGLPFIILYTLLFKYVGNIKLYKPLLLSLFNLFVYVGLSVLTRVIWGKNVPLPPYGIMFWTACIAIFLSPIILGQIPYFRKLMENL
jgi:hypothetical protein